MNDSTRRSSAIRSGASHKRSTATPAIARQASADPPPRPHKRVKTSFTSTSNHRQQFVVTKPCLAIVEGLVDGSIMTTPTPADYSHDVFSNDCYESLPRQGRYLEIPFATRLGLWCAEFHQDKLGASPKTSTPLQRSLGHAREHPKDLRGLRLCLRHVDHQAIGPLSRKQKSTNWEVSCVKPWLQRERDLRKQQVDTAASLGSILLGSLTITNVQDFDSPSKTRTIKILQQSVAALEALQQADTSDDFIIPNLISLLTSVEEDDPINTSQQSTPDSEMAVAVELAHGISTILVAANRDYDYRILVARQVTASPNETPAHNVSSPIIAMDLVFGCMRAEKAARDSLESSAPSAATSLSAQPKFQRLTQDALDLHTRSFSPETTGKAANGAHMMIQRHAADQVAALAGVTLNAEDTGKGSAIFKGQARVAMEDTTVTMGPTMLAVNNNTAAAAFIAQAPGQGMLPSIAKKCVKSKPESGYPSRKSTLAPAERTLPGGPDSLYGLLLAAKMKPNEESTGGKIDDKKTKSSANNPKRSGNQGHVSTTRHKKDATNQIQETKQTTSDAMGSANSKRAAEPRVEEVAAGYAPSMDQKRIKNAVDSHRRTMGLHIEKQSEPTTASPDSLDMALESNQMPPPLKRLEAGTKYEADHPKTDARALARGSGRNAPAPEPISIAGMFYFADAQSKLVANDWDLEHDANNHARPTANERESYPTVLGKDPSWHQTKMAVKPPTKPPAAKKPKLPGSADHRRLAPQKKMTVVITSRKDTDRSFGVTYRPTLPPSTLTPCQASTAVNRVSLSADPSRRPAQAANPSTARVPVEQLDLELERVFATIIYDSPAREAGSVREGAEGRRGDKPVSWSARFGLTTQETSRLKYPCAHPQERHESIRTNSELDENEVALVDADFHSAHGGSPASKSSDAASTDTSEHERYASFIHDGFFGLHDESTVVEAGSDDPVSLLATEVEYSFHDTLFGLSEVTLDPAEGQRGSIFNWFISAFLLVCLFGLTYQHFSFIESMVQAARAHTSE